MYFTIYTIICAILFFMLIVPLAETHEIKINNDIIKRL